MKIHSITLILLSNMPRQFKVDNIGTAENNQSHMNSGPKYIQNEIKVVFFAHTGPYQRTMMVKSFDAKITNVAMRRSWRPENIATGAMFDFQ